MDTTTKGTTSVRCNPVDKADIALLRSYLGDEKLSFMALHRMGIKALKEKLGLDKPAAQKPTPKQKKLRD